MVKYTQSLKKEDTNRPDILQRERTYFQLLELVAGDTCEIAYSRNSTLGTNNIGITEFVPPIGQEPTENQNQMLRELIERRANGGEVLVVQEAISPEKLPMGKTQPCTPEALVELFALAVHALWHDSDVQPAQGSSEDAYFMRTGIRQQDAYKFLEEAAAQLNLADALKKAPEQAAELQQHLTSLQEELEPARNEAAAQLGELNERVASVSRLKSIQAGLSRNS